MCLLTIPLTCQEESVQPSDDDISNSSASYTLETAAEIRNNRDKIVLNPNLSPQSSVKSLSDEFRTINEIVERINNADKVKFVPRDPGIESVFYCVEGCFVIKNLDCNHDKITFDSR